MTSPMTFRSLLRAARLTPIEVTGDGVVSSITIDSRKVGAGALFVCMPGGTRESESFIPEAASAGAGAVIVHSPAGMVLASGHGLAAALIPHSGVLFNDACWRLCEALFDHP